MKEAEDCQKLREAVNQAKIRRYPNGETHLGKPKILKFEFIEFKSKRRELKHLSSARNKKQRDSLCSGERKGNSLNSYQVIACVRSGMEVVGCKCYIMQDVGHDYLI